MMIETNLGIGSRIVHNSYGEGIISSSKGAKYKICFFGKGIIDVPKDSDELKLLEEIIPDEGNVRIDDIETTLIDLLKRWSDISEVVHIADKWKNGSLIIKPYDDALKPKEIPIDSFFNKIVMLRDRLRVLEQKINAHPKLDNTEKVEMQQYITRIYGSLTTFNILFKNQSQVFVGEKGSKE